MFDESERISYFGSLKLSDANLDALIRQSIILAESPDGAGRQLEIVQHIEQKFVPSTNRFFLEHRPIIPNSAAIQIRGGHVGYLYGSFPLSENEWRTLTDGFSIDNNTAEVVLTGIFAPEYTLSGYWGRGSSNRPTQRYQQPQVKVTYQSGFDFTSNSTIVRKLKDIIAAIVRLLAENKAASSGIESYVLEGFYEAAFSKDAATGMIQTYLKSIKQLVT